MIKIPPNPFEAILRNDAVFKQAARKASLTFAQRIAGRIRRKIGAQEENLEPLSPAYKARKMKLGLNPDILEATEEYRDSIQARTAPDGKGYVVAAADRPHQDKRLSKSDASLEQIGTWLEFGTYNVDGSVRMPARPHWRPVLAEIQANPGSALDDFKEDLLEALDEALDRMDE